MNIRLKYFIIGALFGMCFPVGALIFEFQRLSLPLNWENFQLVHAENLVLYMIDSAPLFLGLFALLGGISKEKSIHLIQEFKHIADFLSQNTDALRQQSVHTLQEYADSIHKLAKDYSSIDQLNRFTFSEIHTTLEGTSRVGNEIERMKGSLDQITNYNKSVGDNHSEIKNYLTGYLNKIQKLNDYFNYLNDFSREIELLAVNSAIEANKYGAQGKAFLVFAHNIQRLAHETKARNKDVLQLMEIVSKETDLLSGIIDNERDNIQVIMDLAAQVNAAAGQFESVIRGFVDNLQEASEHLNQQNHLTIDFGKTLKTIRDSNQTIMVQLQEVVEEQISIIDQMNHVASPQASIHTV